MRYDLAWTGGAALTAGFLIGIIPRSLPHSGSGAAAGGTAPAIPRTDRAVAELPVAETVDVTDVVERCRIAAAV